ncbi:type III polyketide synthase [Streptomyces venezuelae]|uniref:type III polyketide synthase n=1 Tax=Streptomyces venezuelae TaxID=54571 RepID=UPI0034157D4E
MAHVTRPSVVFPPHEITTADIADDTRNHAPSDSPLLGRLDSLMASLQVERRRFIAPLNSVAASGSVDCRNQIALEGMLQLGEQAAQDALRSAGLTARDIDIVITSHSTTLATPGLDVHLVNRLGLRPDVWRVPSTQLGCVGGAHTLTLAARLADASPGSRVLVVVSEALSTVYQRDDTTITGLIYRALFGDSAGACIVSSDALGAGLHVRRGWQYTVPGTQDYYALHTETDGMHFTSTRNAPSGVNHLAAPLWQWLHEADGDWTPDLVIAHPGGPAVLNLTAKALNCPVGLLSHSWDSLRERGNLGGVSILDILARTQDESPRHGSRTLVLGVGPGLTGAAIEGTWHAPATAGG